VWVEKNNEGGCGEKHIMFYLISLLTLTLMVRVGGRGEILGDLMDIPLEQFVTTYLIIL
jgi:hypothetical protein